MWQKLVPFLIPKSQEVKSVTTLRVRPDGGLNLREKPNGRIIDVLRADDEVSVIEKVSFYRVKTSDGISGYVHGDFVEEYPSELESVTTTSSSNPFPSPSFNLVKFSGRNFIGKPAMVDNDFIRSLNRIDDYAETCLLKVWITSSTRNLNEQVRGAIVPPASKSCHHIGHAIDMNIQHEGKLFNSKKLKKSNLKKLPERVFRFIQLIRGDDELRWGGDFNKEDPVHIDDNLFHQQEAIYLAKLQSRVAQLNA